MRSNVTGICLTSVVISQRLFLKETITFFPFVLNLVWFRDLQPRCVCAQLASTFAAFNLQIRVLSPDPRFIPKSAFYPRIRVLSPNPRFISKSANNDKEPCTSSKENNSCFLLLVVLIIVLKFLLSPLFWRYSRLLKMNTWVKFGSETLLALHYILYLFEYSPAINLHKLTAGAGGTEDK